MTEKEFDSKWGNVNIDDLDLEQMTEFKEDCFKLYEETGFIDKFDSPYDDQDEHNGRAFKVIRRARPFNSEGSTEEERGEADLEAMPLWLVEFENGDEALCYPEEICLLEHREPQKP